MENLTNGDALFSSDIDLPFVKIMRAKTVHLTIQPFRIRLESDFKDTCSQNYLVSVFASKNAHIF